MAAAWIPANFQLIISYNFSSTVLSDNPLIAPLALLVHAVVAAPKHKAAFDGRQTVGNASINRRTLRAAGLVFWEPPAPTRQKNRPVKFP